MCTDSRLTRTVGIVGVCVVAGAVVVAARGDESRGEETTEQQFVVTGVPEIVVRNNTDGRTSVRVSEGDTVLVRTVREGRDADELEVRIHQDGDRITTEVNRPYRRWFSWGRSPRVHVDIETPRLSDVDIRSDDGELNISDVEGRLVLVVDDGDVFITGTSGELRVVGDDGDLDLTDVKGSANVRADDGQLTVTGFEGRLALTVEDGDMVVTDTSGELTAEAEDGDIDLRHIRGTVEARTEDGRLRLDGVLTALHVRTDDGAVDIRAETGSKMEEDWSIRGNDGRVTLALPDGFAADVLVQTDDGTAEIEQPITVRGNVSRHRISGELNGGGYELRLQSDDGRVTITR